MFIGLFGTASSCSVVIGLGLVLMVFISVLGGVKRLEIAVSVVFCHCPGE